MTPSNFYGLLEGMKRFKSGSPVKPWLMTYDEYLSLANPEGKYHTSSAYQVDVSRLNSYKRKEDFQHLLKTANGIEYRMRKEKVEYAKWDDLKYAGKMSDEEMEQGGLANLRADLSAWDGDDCVGAAQDEWGCVLYMVAEEYQGEGIGVTLGHLYRSIYPDKGSGGFTPSGKKAFQKVYLRFVEEAIKYRKYEKAVRAGEITQEKVEEITGWYRSMVTGSDPNYVPPRLADQKIAKDLLARAQSSPYITNPDDYEDVRQIILSDPEIGELLWSSNWSDRLYDWILPQIKRMLEN